MRVPIVGLLVLIGSTGASAAGFDPGCTLPFAAIQEAHALDQTCAAEGDATEAPHQGGRGSSGAAQGRELPGAFSGGDLEIELRVP
jgi:hypothetical protein